MADEQKATENLDVQPTNTGAENQAMAEHPNPQEKQQAAPEQAPEKQKKQLPQHETEQDRVIEDKSEEVFALLDERITQAKRIIKKAPHADYRGDILYGIPWYLFIGNTQSDIKSVLQTANYHDPVPPLYQKDQDPAALWSWWFLKKMVGVEVNCDAIGNPMDQQQKEYWQKALYLLLKRRSKIPINGVVACVSATTLLESQKNTPGEEKLQNLGKTMRYMIDECQKNFYIQFPVTIMITHMDQLSGFNGFVEALPPHLEQQALGYRFEPILKKSREKQNNEEKAEEAFAHFYQQFTPLRLGLLKKHKHRQNPYAIYALPEQIQMMKHGVNLLAETLFGENPYQYNPFWRGLYMVAEESNTPFMQDVFEKFLPVDQPLARKR